MSDDPLRGYYDASYPPSLYAPVPDVAPVLTTLAPDTLDTSDPPTTITITGTGFTSSSTVSVGGSTVASTFVGPTSITFVLDVSTATPPATVPVRVSNGTAPSNVLNVDVPVLDPEAAP